MSEEKRYIGGEFVDGRRFTSMKPSSQEPVKTRDGTLVRLRGQREMARWGEGRL